MTYEESMIHKVLKDLTFVLSNHKMKEKMCRANEFK